jgi:hypothetical protein
MLASRFFLSAVTIACLVSFSLAQQPCNSPTLPLQPGQLAVQLNVRDRKLCENNP